MTIFSKMTSLVIVDRPVKEALLAIGSTSLAFLIVLPLYSEDVTQISHVLTGGLIGAGLITAGFAATSRCRPLPRKTGMQRRVRLGVLALTLGALLGLANLGANFGLAMLDQSIYNLLVQRFTGSPWGSIFAAPVIEEVTLRLFFMGIVAWIAARFTDDSRTVFLIALWLSAIVFGLLHMFRPMPDSSSLEIIYIAGVVIKSGAATFLLGWIFWRWGLPYAIICHAAANAIHNLVEPVLF